jgi:hypothetical protein
MLVGLSRRDYSCAPTTCRQNDNDQRPESFNFGKELIFCGRWNFLAAVTSVLTLGVGEQFPSAVTARRHDMEKSRVRHGSGTRYGMELLKKSDGAILRFRRCDPV